VLILAIDTSTEQGGLAVVEDGIPRAEWSWTALGNHSQHLDALLRSMLAVEQLETASLNAIAVASGPGSFSGLRVGVSYAKGLALALGIPLIGVSTLEVIAFPGMRVAVNTIATISAGREQLYVGHFRGNEAHWERTRPYAIMQPSEVVELVDEATLLSGPGAVRVAEELRQLGRPARVEPPVWRLRRPGFLAELGSQCLAKGAVDQVHTLEPIYIRRPAAEEKHMASQEGSEV
jgi:tRNA threonylcarbamoyladenosine biosynthesis protein TsaB